MTNEEKAKEIAMPCQGCECEWTKEKMYKQQYCKDCVAQDKFIAAIEAMEWKDVQFEKEKQQLIDKACEWWKNEFKTHEMKYKDSKDWYNSKVERFKQAMKGE